MRDLLATKTAAPPPAAKYQCADQTKTFKFAPTSPAEMIEKGSSDAAVSTGEKLLSRRYYTG